MWAGTVHPLQAQGTPTSTPTPRPAATFTPVPATSAAGLPQQIDGTQSEWLPINTRLLWLGVLLAVALVLLAWLYPKLVRPEPRYPSTETNHHE